MKVCLPFQKAKYSTAFLAQTSDFKSFIQTLVHSLSLTNIDLEGRTEGSGAGRQKSVQSKPS